MLDLPTDGTFSCVRIAELLAPTLGWEKSSEVVAAAVARLDLSPDALRPDHALSVLDELSRTPGMVGIAARFARSRIDAARAPPPASADVPTSGPTSVRGPRSTPQPDTLRAGARPSGTQGTTITAGEVAALLASAMGVQKAEEVVLAAARRLGFPPERLDKAQAIALLDQLAVEPGVVGLCARFGKARLILRFAA